MEAKELMIGDWVLYDPNVFIEDEYEPYKELYPTKIENGEEIDLAIEHCYSPIPLTKEILEKNGFNFINCVYPAFYLKGEGIELREREYTSEGLYELELIVCNKIVYLHYVHELQHILRLCGINKEIEL